MQVAFLILRSAAIANCRFLHVLIFGVYLHDLPVKYLPFDYRALSNYVLLCSMMYAIN